MKTEIENAKETLKLDSKKIYREDKYRKTNIGTDNREAHAQDQMNHKSKIVDKSNVYDFDE